MKEEGKNSTVATSVAPAILCSVQNIYYRPPIHTDTIDLPELNVKFYS
jgi:hypothetical protein